MNHWLIPCNVKNFDIVHHFSITDTAFFKKNRALSVGDIVYIYVASPYSAVLYKGEIIKAGVLSSELPEEYIMSWFDSGTYVEVKKIVAFPDQFLTRDKLKDFGVGQVVNQQSISGKTLDKLLSLEDKLLGGDE